MNIRNISFKHKRDIMAKKKNVEPEEDLDDFGDLEDEKIETVFPDMEKKSSETDETTEEITSESDEEDEEEYVDLELEDEVEVLDYKYIKLVLRRKTLDNDYELDVIGQSHGFCNIFVNHLLNIEGVNMAAYKVTRIEPAKIYLRLENEGFKIKDILFKGIESLREEFVEVQKTFQKLM